MSDHFWKWWCRKSAGCCGAKCVSKSKCGKHTMLGPLLEVDMSKKCTLLWHEAHFQVKSAKNWGVRSTFGRSDVVLRGRRKGFRTLPKVRKTWGFCSSFNYNHHYSKLHSTPLHYTTTTTTITTTTTLHYTTLITLHYTTLHYTELHYTTVNYTTLTTTTAATTTTTLHYTTLRYLHYTTSHSTSLHHTTLHYTQPHYTTTTATTTTATTTTTLHYSNYFILHYTTLHYTTRHHTALHHTTPHYTTQHYTNDNYSYKYNYARLHYTRLHYTTLHNITLHSLHHHKCNCNYPTLITLHHNYNSTTLRLQLQLRYTTLHIQQLWVKWPTSDHCNHCNHSKKTQLQPPFRLSVNSLCHPWFATTNLSYRFPVSETSATALCGTTGTNGFRGTLFKHTHMTHSWRIWLESGTLKW